MFCHEYQESTLDLHYEQPIFTVMGSNGSQLVFNFNNKILMVYLFRSMTTNINDGKNPQSSTFLDLRVICTFNFSTCKSKNKIYFIIRLTMIFILLWISVENLKIIAENKKLRGKDIFEGTLNFLPLPKLTLLPKSEPLSNWVTTCSFAKHVKERVCFVVLLCEVKGTKFDT